MKPVLSALACAGLLGVAAPAHAVDAAAAICTDQAVDARHISLDRDAGVSKAEELRRIDHVLSLSPARVAILGHAQLPVFVDAIYGRYAHVPPAQIYARYLAYCTSKAEAARRAVAERPLF